MMIKLQHAKNLPNIEARTKLEELNQSSTRAIADLLLEQKNTAMAQMQVFAFGGVALLFEKGAPLRLRPFLFWRFERMARQRAYGSIRKSDQKLIAMRFHPAVLAQIERQAKRHGLSAGRWAEATLESIVTGALVVTNA